VKATDRPLGFALASSLGFWVATDHRSLAAHPFPGVTKIPLERVSVGGPLRDGSSKCPFVDGSRADAEIVIFMLAAGGASPCGFLQRCSAAHKTSTSHQRSRSRPILLSCLHRPGLKVPLAGVAMSGSQSACGAVPPCTTTRNRSLRPYY